MEKRLLIAFALSFAIILGWRYYMEKTMPAPPVKTTPAETLKKTEIPEKPPVANSKNPAVPTPMEVKTAAAEKQIEVETDLYKIVFSNREAVARHWILKKYTDSHQAPLDLIDAKLGGTYGYPLGIRVLKEENSSQTLGNALFQVLGPEKIQLAGQETASLEFEFSDQSLRVWKKITFAAGSYLVETECKAWLNGQPAEYLLLWQGGFGDRSVNPQTAVHESIYRAEGAMNRLRSDKVRKKVEAQLEEAAKANQPPRNNLEFSGRIEYAGLNDQYFAAVFLPAGNEPLRNYRVSEDVRKKEDGKEEILLKAAVSGGNGETTGFRIFVGPKDTEILKKTGSNLVELIDYGWFKFFCQPMFITLKWLYSFSKNYGAAIILLTILISLALLPLRWKSMHSAQKMQKLQPQMKAIQEKYKKLKATDPKKQQMNQEVMALYKQHGVNPLGGCLPLLIQLPFFYAIYNLLSVAIELRQAPFIWWIKDLSLPDHAYVLPILFTASMIAIQKMTPMPSADPIQAKMMMAMPLVFGFMLSATPSGLVLYWLTSNLVGIVQQVFMNRYGPGAQEKMKEAKKKER